MKRFVEDERGNFAVIGALMTTLLVGALGGALDVSRQWNEQSIIQRAADVASLAGAKALEFGTEADAQQAIQDAAWANLPPDFQSVSFVGTIDNAAGTVSVTADAPFKPYFLQLFSIENLSISAASKSLIQRKSYIDFFLALDVSESMNIAASEADRKKLEAYTAKYGKEACAFACHTGTNPAYFNLARQAGVRLRIDVLQDAADSMIDKVLSLNSQAGSLQSTRVATGGFSWDYQIGMAPATNATALKQSIRNFSNANGGTNMIKALSGLTQQLGSQGKGTSQSDVRKFAILITDGVRDLETGSREGYGPVDPALCRVIKSLGIDLIVLEIKYVANDDKGNFFRDRVSWYYNSISPSLKRCASPGFYYQATDSDEAERQLLGIVDDILSVRRRLAS